MAGNEIFWNEDFILSETDERGVITYANDAFCAVAQYNREELIGKPHNIVRHPDMPKIAFRMLWDDIRKKGYWQGIVKNLAKNGDFYWVAAVVLRKIDSSGRHTYCSIRSRASRQQVEDAEKLYATLR